MKERKGGQGSREQEKPTQRKRKRMFTYSEEERKAFEDAWLSGHDTGGLTMKDYYDRYNQSHKKELKEDYRLWRQRTGGKLDFRSISEILSPNQKEQKKE